jgi:transposase
MKKVARMLRSHPRTVAQLVPGAKKLISADVVEGFNNKAKLTTRRAYGFRTFRAAEIPIYHTLAALPEWRITHRFC